MSKIEETAILVDAHVHIYDCFELDSLLDAALQNFCKAAYNNGLQGAFMGVLLLTETKTDNWFQHTRDMYKNNQHLHTPEERWEIQLTSDSTVLRAKHIKGGQRDEKPFNETQIYIIAGRQIITSEGLELLALATDSHFDDGMSISETLDVVRESDAIPVIPWAVGKWLGKRGKILSSFLSNRPHNGLFLGDNSGRPVFWPNPSHFKQARELNMRILPGTDPLPFASQAIRIGSFGFIVHGRLDDAQPASDLKQLLRATQTKILAYGQLEKPWRFFANQIRLRIARFL